MLHYSQLRTALKLLNNLSCLKGGAGGVGSREESEEGQITDLGRALSKLPLNVRFAKMLLGAVGSGVLDLTIMLVACMSEQSPFLDTFGGVGREDEEKKKGEQADSEEAKKAKQKEKEKNEVRSHKLRSDDPNGIYRIMLTPNAFDYASQHWRSKWKHPYGDPIARVLAAGAYHHAGNGAGGVTEEVACRAFCTANDLNYTVLGRIQKLRTQLTKVVGMRLGLQDSEGLRSKLRVLPPPTRIEQLKLSQLLSSGLLDNVAKKATGGEVVGKNGVVRRDAYLACSGSLKQPLYLSARCALYDRQWKNLPEFVVYESVLMRQRSGDDVAVMDNVAKVEPVYLSALAEGSPLLKVGKVDVGVNPVYDKAADAIMCYRLCSYGEAGWSLPPKKEAMEDDGDRFLWFARYLLEGAVHGALKALSVDGLLGTEPREITLRKPKRCVMELIARLRDADVDCMVKFGAKLKADNRWLWTEVKGWCKKDAEMRSKFKKVWGDMVKDVVLRIK